MKNKKKPKIIFYYIPIPYNWGKNCKNIIYKKFKKSPKIIIRIYVYIFICMLVRCIWALLLSGHVRMYIRMYALFMGVFMHVYMRCSWARLYVHISSVYGHVCIYVCMHCYGRMYVRLYALFMGTYVCMCKLALFMGVYVFIYSYICAVYWRMNVCIYAGATAGMCLICLYVCMCVCTSIHILVRCLWARIYYE